MSHDRIPLAAVIGSPIEHSRSPALHGYWLRKYGVNGHYVPMNITQEDLPEVIKTLPKMGFVGANVTIPHKQTVLDLADSVSDRAAVIGAANTLIFRPDGTLMADNTDGHGFFENLKQYAPDWDPKTGPAAVFGAGGAARAIIHTLLRAGAPKLCLSNRTRSRAEDLRREFGTKIEVWDWNEAGDMLIDATTVVNTTSLGMVGQEEFKVPLDKLRTDAVVNDLVYTPLETEFLASARAKGCTVVDGLGMLLHQAVPGFERWFGTRPEVDDDLRETVLNA